MIDAGPLVAPFDFEVAAAQFDGGGTISAARQHRGHQCGACTGAAGERFAQPRSHTRIRRRLRDHQDEFRIDPAREEGMVLELPAQPGKIRIVERENAFVVTKTTQCGLPIETAVIPSWP